MEQLLVCALCTAAHIPSLILRYLPFSCVVEKKQRNLLLTLYGVALAANFALCLWLLQNDRLSIPFYKANLLVFCMVMAAVNIAVIPGHLQEHLFTFGLVAIFILMMAAGSAYLADAIGYDTISHGLILSNLALLGLFFLFYRRLSRLMLQTVTPFLNLQSKDYWRTIWSIPIAMFLASLLAVPMDGYTNSLGLVASKLLIGIATLFICRSVAQDYERMAENQFLNEQMEAQKHYYRAISEKMQAEREARHNYKHHLAAVQGFLDTGDTDRLRDYLQQLEGTLPTGDPVLHTGNPAVDGILTHYARVAKAAGIRLEVQCRFPERGILDVDLCNLLGNALDNAVTAAQGGGERWIKLVSELAGDTLLITVTNSFDGLVQRDNERILSKKRVMQEGIGLQTMRKLCEKYHGVSKFSWEGNEFHASFMLICEAPPSPGR